MTKVIKIYELKNCSDSSIAKEFELDEPLNEEIMNRMAQNAKLGYFPHFPRKYFKIEKKGLFIAQGVIGKTIFRVTPCHENPLQALSILKGIIEED